MWWAKVVCKDDEKDAQVSTETKRALNLLNLDSEVNNDIDLPRHWSWLQEMLNATPSNAGVPSSAQQASNIVSNIPNANSCTAN